MKKLIIALFCVVLLCSPAYGWGLMGFVGDGGEDPWAAGRGTADFYFCGENTTDHTTAYTEAGTKTGTLVDATISTDQNHTTDGSYAFDCTAADDYCSWAVSSGDIFNSAAGYMDFYFWPESDRAATVTIFEAVNGADVFYIEYRTNDYIFAYHLDDSVYAGTLTDGAWNHIEIRWDAAGDSFDIKINDGSWTEDADTITAFSAEPTTIKMGESAAGGGYNELFYLDDFKIWTTFDQS